MYFQIGVVVAKRKLKSIWQDHMFIAHSVMPTPPDTPLGANLGVIGDDELFYGGAHELRVFTGETGHYRDNLNSGAPSIWVGVNARGEVTAVAIDPYEGEALVTNNIDDVIERLPMPENLQYELADFYDKHHVEHVFVKRKRNKFNTDTRSFEGKDDA
jgi:hypothetical protein